MKPNFDSESDEEDVVQKRPKKTAVIESDEEDFANERTANEDLQSLQKADETKEVPPDNNDEEYAIEEDELEENFLEDETESMSKAERKRLKKRRKKKEKKKLMRELYERIVAGENLTETEGLDVELIEQIKQAFKYEEEKEEEGDLHGNFRKRKAQELDVEDGLLGKPRKRRKLSEKKQKEAEMNDLFEEHKIRREMNLNSLMADTEKPKSRTKLLSLLTNIAVKSPIVKKKKRKPRKTTQKPKTPTKSPSKPGLRMTRKDSFTVTKMGTQTDLGVTSKLKAHYVEKKIVKTISQNSPALKQRNLMKDKLARIMAKKRRKMIRKHEREFGKEEDYMQHAEDSMLAETLQSQMEISTPTKQPPPEPDNDYVLKASDSDDSDLDEDEFYVPTLGKTPEKSKEALPDEPAEKSEDILEENSQSKKSKDHSSPLEQSDAIEKEKSAEAKSPLEETPEKMEIDELEEEEESESSDAEEIDLEKLLKKKNLDEEDEALLRLMGHGEQEMDPETKALLDIEAVDDDEEDNGAGAQDEHEKKFGVVKGLLAKKKVKETEEERKWRRQLDAIRREQDDEAEQVFFERAFIDGDISLLKQKREFLEGTGDMKFVCRDKALGENPEDYIVSDDEANADCFDENGNFLPVWKIRLNRARREKLKSLDADFFSSDEDADEGLSKEERLAQRKARFEAKLKNEISSKKTASADKFFGPEQTEGKEEPAKKTDASAKKKRAPVFKRAKRRLSTSLKGRISRFASECESTTPKKQSGKSFVFKQASRARSEPEKVIDVKHVQKQAKRKKKPKLGRGGLFASLDTASQEPKLGRSFDKKLVRSLTIE